MEAFISALRNFVQNEHEARINKIRSMWRRPLEERLAAGEAVTDLSVVSVRHGLAVLRYDGHNLSNFREDDRLRLNHGHPADSYISCILLKEGINELTFLPGYRETFAELRHEPDGWILDRDIVDNRDVLIPALDELKKGLQHHKTIFEVFDAPRPMLDGDRQERAHRVAISAGLDPRQVEALERAFAAQNFYLVQGGPGTGKTHVLAHLAGALAREGRRVLVTGPDYHAVNHALEMVARHGGHRQVCKIGPEWEAPVGVPNYESLAASPYHPTDRGFIVGATPYTTRDERLNVTVFDSVLFDEASSLSIPDAITAMLAGRHYVFFGDPLGIPPEIVGEHEPAWTAESVLHSLSRRMSGTILDTTYRLADKIAAFPSKEFYHDRLIPAPDAAILRLDLPTEPPRYADILDPAHGLVFADIRHKNRKKASPEEAKLIAKLVAVLLACGLPPEELAVLSYYRAQSRLARKYSAQLIEHMGGKLPPEVLFDTPEGMRGKGRDVVIFSVTTSNPGYAAAHADRFYSPNLLNIAITRARSKLIIIASPHVLRTNDPDPYVQEGTARLHALLRSGHHVLIPLKRK